MKELFNASSRHSNRRRLKILLNNIFSKTPGLQQIIDEDPDKIKTDELVMFLTNKVKSSDGSNMIILPIAKSESETDNIIFEEN